MTVPFEEILLRSKSSPIVDEQAFDMSLFHKTQALQQKYDITYDPEKPIDLDGSLADRIFEAGMELFLDLGTYCVSTRRVIKLTKEELAAEIDAAPDAITLGEGEDQVEMVHRDVEGSQVPIVIAGVQTAPFSDEEMMHTIYKGCAMDRCVDGIWGGILLRIRGTYEVIAGAPTEIYQYRKTAEILRDAINDAGRPGMIIVNNAPSSAATIGMFNEERGLRKTDYMCSTAMSECKVGYDDLNRSAFALAHGVSIHGAHSSTIGGFSANPEGAAITAVAASFQLVTVHKAESFRCGVVDSRIKSRQTRGQLWAAGTAIQALSRNTRLIVDGSIGDHPSAGPGTKQYFYESAAGHIVSTVTGAHSTAGTRKFIVGSTPNYGTPLESRWMGEVCKGATGMDRKSADALVRYLLARYEEKIQDAPEGHTFEKLYDVDSLQPLPHYQEIYEGVKREFENQGFHFGEYR